MDGKNDSQPSEPKLKSFSKRNHWHLYISIANVISRIALAGAALWYARTNAHEQRLQANKAVAAQIAQQDAARRSQREIEEATLALNFLESFKCSNTPERDKALQVLGSVSTKQAFLMNSGQGLCGSTPGDQQIAEQAVLQSKANEDEFTQHLSLARLYRNAGLQSEASREYEKAVEFTTTPIARMLDPKIRASAQEALNNQDFSKASDIFEQYFGQIQGP
jgi:hypothetical protein